ncbi:Ribokinase-like protein [Dipodascopsis uninucleata]
MPYSLFVLGNPLLDIQTRIDVDFLNKYGLKANDAILADEKHMPIFDYALKNSTVVLAGGAAQNTARGAQYILPSGSVVYTGCVGNDEFSETLKKANEREGVYSAYQVEEEIPTGVCAVLISGNDRSLVTNLAAANHFKVDHLKKPEIAQMIEEAKYYYVGGYHLTVCTPAILELGKHAAENNKIFSMNFSAPFLAQFFKDQMDSVVPYLDFFIGNETEALAYAESHGYETKDITEIASKIAALPKVNTARPRYVIITQGSDSTIVVKAETTGAVSTKTYPIRKINSSDIVDTNGAGDSFAGGFLGGLISGKSVDEAIEVGHWLASWTIRLDGPAYPYPKISYTA